ncbi:MAG: hypothetical protein M0P09_07570 [Acholeplasmataceae bacterium]|nr:hypothetical protein [Acholeplasmataceae bacterium]
MIKPSYRSDYYGSAHQIYHYDLEVSLFTITKASEDANRVASSLLILKKQLNR